MIPSSGSDTFFYRKSRDQRGDLVEIVAGGSLSSPFYAETFSTLPFKDKIDTIEQALGVEIDLRSVWCGLNKQPNWTGTHLTRSWSLVPDLVCENSWAWKERVDGLFELHLLYTHHERGVDGSNRNQSTPIVLVGPTLAHCYIEGILVSLAKTLL